MSLFIFSPITPMPFKIPQTIRLDALLAAQLPPAIPVISPWLHAGESCLLWADTGTGKSMLAQTLAIGAASGGEALGWTFPKPARVLYVDGEQSMRDIQGRFRMLRSAVDGHDPAKTLENLFVMARAGQSHPADFFDLTATAQRKAILAYIKREGFRLVIFDNFSVLTDGLEDENSAAAIRPMQALLTHLKALNVAVILVHHSKKGGLTYRGSSGIATTFERILGMTREGGSAVRISAAVTLEKYRGKAPPGFSPSFRLELQTTADTERGEVARWIVGNVGPLADAWHLYSTGAHRSHAEFVEIANKKLGTSFTEGNLKRDLLDKCVALLRIDPKEIEGAKKRMRYLAKTLEADDETEVAPEAQTRGLHQSALRADF